MFTPLKACPIAFVFSLTLLAGCGTSQWEITIENQGTSPCSIYVTMGYANANSQGNSKAYVEDMSAGYKSTLISGQSVRTIRSVKFVRGEDEQLLEPNVEIHPGMRYVIVMPETGKVQATLEE